MILQDTVETSLTIGGVDYGIIDLTTNFSRYNEVDSFDAKVVPLTDDEPDEDDVADLEINNRDVFRGFVNAIGYNEDGSYQVTVLNDLYKVKNTPVVLSIREATPLSTVVREVCDIVGVDYNVDLTWHTTPDTYQALDFVTTAVETGTNAAKVLDKLAERSNADWWFDNNNVLQFGMPESELHELKYILNPGVTTQLPPYRGVKVVGDSVVSQEGWSYSHLAGAEAVTAKYGIFRKTSGACTVPAETDGETTEIPAPCWEIRRGETNGPVFELKDKQINTAQSANNVARKLIEELYKQIRGGTITIVGTQDNDSARIDSLDIVQMPDDMGGERYFVGRVNHKINSDGYTVEIECEGLVPGRYDYNPVSV